MSKVNLARLAVYECQCRFYRVFWHIDCPSPFIECTAWNVTNQALSSCIHYPIHNIIQCTITSIAYHQAAALFGSLLCQFQCLALVLFQCDAGFPTSGREDGYQIRNVYHILPRSEVNYDTGLFAAHSKLL